jgi:hypothetical protein
MAFIQLLNLTAQNHRIKCLNLSAKQVTCRPGAVDQGLCFEAPCVSICPQSRSPADPRVVDQGLCFEALCAEPAKRATA